MLTTHVGATAKLHLAQLVQHPEDMPSSVLTLGIPRNLMQKEQNVLSLVTTGCVSPSAANMTVLGTLCSCSRLAHHQHKGNKASPRGLPHPSLLVTLYGLVSEPFTQSWQSPPKSGATQMQSARSCLTSDDCQTSVCQSFANAMRMCHLRCWH